MSETPIPEGVLNAEFPSKLRPLFKPHRYKILFGGRGGSKSWGAARAILIKGVQSPTRVLCAREIMKTLRDSVHQLLVDQIALLGLEDFYTVTNDAITGINGTQIVFTGLRAITAANIKSFEGVDICWIEEAQAVTAKSWGVLIPTIRKEGSELWLTFNPELDTDNTWVRFVENTPPDSVVIEINWRDNPWFTKILDQERRHSKATEDEETYNNIWEGKPRTVMAGAIYAPQVLSMVKSKRYRSVPYDPRLLVHTVWDLGWNDQTSIIFVQKLRNEIMIIDYLEASFLTLPDWVKVLDKLPYTWGTDWLPWDGGTTSRQTGKSDKLILKGLGRKSVRSSIQLSNANEARIKSARTMFPRVYLDNTMESLFEVGDLVVTRGCGRLMECLKRYRRNILKTTDEPSSPLHDTYSHAADAFGELALNIDQMKNENETPPPVIEEWGQAVKGVM